MKQFTLVILVTFFSTIAFAQKRLVVIDNNDGDEVRKIDLTKVFTYRVKNSTAWRNGFVTQVGKDSVHLNNGTYPIKNFEYIRQSPNKSAFFNTISDGALYGALTAAGVTLTLFIIELNYNNHNYSDHGYPLTLGGLGVTVGMAVIGGSLKLITGRKTIPLGGRFSLSIQ